DIETDKVVLEVVAPEDGVVVEISQADGATVLGEQVIALIGAAGASASAPAQQSNEQTAAATATTASEGNEVDIKVPVLPESVADATIATWHVQPGEAVSRDQNLVDIETDKVVLEVVAPEDGVMGEHIHAEGDTVLGEQVIGKISECTA
ncbi:dihydrolipoamide succinyltransferase, partial [Pseudoalteromonas citrea]